MPFQTTSRYPEWKSLYDGILPLINEGRTSFSYDDMEPLAGIDIRSDRGRLQFYRFRRELLKTKQLWMENIAGYGYNVIPAADQPKAAQKRVQSARRKVNMAKSINALVRHEELTPEQRCQQAAVAIVLHELSKTFHSAAAKLRLASDQASKLADITDLPKLLQSVKTK